jgi:putative spermidine/putrescine transport system permease protein
MLARFAEFLGLEFDSPLFRGNGWGVVLAYVYKETPFGLLFLVPVLRAIPHELISTARGLGASPWLTFWTLIVPRLLPALGTVFLILFIFTFGAYDIPFVVGESSPSMVSQYLYRAYFVAPLDQRPLASGGLIILFLLSLGTVVGYSFLAGSLDEKERTL